MPKTYLSPRRKQAGRTRAFIFGIIGFLVVTFGLIFSLLFIQQNQDIRQKAAGDGSKVEISLGSTMIDNDHLRVNVFINTQAYQLAGLDLQGKISTLAPSAISLDSTSGLSLESVYDKFTSVSDGTQFRVVKFASLGASAITSSHGQKVTLFSFVLTKPSSNQTTVSFDSSLSTISVLGQQGVGVDYQSAQIFTWQAVVAAGSCNSACSDTVKCQSSLSCYQGFCRNSYNPTDSSCALKGGFFIRAYQDLNGNGSQDSSEVGLSRKFQWQVNNDNTWRDYETFSNQNGEGGVVSLPVNSVVVIRETVPSGWTATTPTQPTVTIKENTNARMVFGSRQPVNTVKPTVKPIATNKPTPYPTTQVYIVPAASPTPYPTPTISTLEVLVPSRTPTPSPTIVPAAQQQSSRTLPILLIVVGIILVIGIMGFIYYSSVMSA